jgi:CheY-like chemotaxis protein
MVGILFRQQFDLAQLGLFLSQRLVGLVKLGLQVGNRCQQVFPAVADRLGCHGVVEVCRVGTTALLLFIGNLLIQIVLLAAKVRHHHFNIADLAPLLVNPIEDDSATAEHRTDAQVGGFNVYTTDLGEEGVDLGKLYDYDIILLDLNLPDMSGYEVLRTLRLSKVKTPILILSGLAGIEDKVRGLGFGADDYMTKPFHKDELVARIHAIVRRSKGHASRSSPPAM